MIARDLSEHDALLVEKTLLWKLGRQLTNVSSGHYAHNFRPHDRYHLKLAGFDFQNGIYYYNVGEGQHRNWDDYVKYGFISGGQGIRFRDAMLGFQPGDVAVAYLKKYGFVGVAKILDRARPIREVKIDDRPLLSYNLTCSGFKDHAESDELCEYVAPVKWLRYVMDRAAAKWKPHSGLYTTTHVRASLDGQAATLEFVQKAFDLDLKELVV